MGASDRPLAFADYSVSPKWVFLYLGLLGLFLIGLLICFCWKRRETSAAVTPVGDLEMANAAPWLGVQTSIYCLKTLWLSVIYMNFVLFSVYLVLYMNLLWQKYSYLLRFIESISYEIWYWFHNLEVLFLRARQYNIYERLRGGLHWQWWFLIFVLQILQRNGVW